MSKPYLAFLGCLVVALATAARAGDPVVEIYDLRDLVMPDEARADPEEAERQEWAEAETRRLADVLREYVRPPLADDESIQTFGAGRIGVVARTDRQSWVREFLNEQRRSHDRLFQIETRFVRLPDDDFHHVFGDGEVPIVLDSVEAADLDEELQRLSRVDILASPRLVVRNRMKASIRVMNQLSYVKEYVVHENVYPDQEALIVPVIENLDDGVFMETRATSFVERGIGIELELVVSEVERPIPRVVTDFGPIATPEVHRAEVTSRMFLTPGATAVFPSGIGEQRLVALVRVREFRFEESGPLDPVPARRERREQ